MNRNFKDINAKAAVALPAAGAANFTASIDLGTTLPGPMVDYFDVLVELPATPSLVDAKTITLTLKDSADGVTFTAIPSLAPIVSTGAGGAGAAAISQTYKLPPTVRRYIRLDQAVLAAGGDNTAVSGSVSLVF